jgi:hypothetical protein
MKNLLTAAKGNQFVRGLSGSILLSLAALIFAFAFWTTNPLHAKDDPSPSASDFDGSSDPNKCTICHVPPGNPNKALTLTIGCSAVQAHLRNHPGDCLGPCPCQPTPKTNP